MTKIEFELILNQEIDRMVNGITHPLLVKSKIIEAMELYSKEQSGLQWVKASDRLPENDERVFIYKRTGHIIVAKFLAIDQWQRENQFIGSGAYYDLTWITHWMSLPAPPKD